MLNDGQRRETAILYVGSRLPELSETFVYREVLGLRAQGRRIAIASVRKPRAFAGDAAVAQLRSDAVVIYDWKTLRWLPIALLRHPLQAFLALADAVRSDHPHLKSRAKHIVQAMMGLALGRRLQHRNIVHVHAHMAHVPATVALYAARSLGAGFSFTGHAADLFVDRAALRFKLRQASFISCISHWHRGFYGEIADIEAARMPIIRCSVAIPDTLKDEQHEIVVVARLVPKKGIDLLLSAFREARLDDWRLRILGDGPERARLEAQAAALGIAEQTRFDGAQPHAACLRAIRTAGIFALPCCTASNGDRDGIPVVLMEAMAGGRAVVAGDLPSIRELVTPGAGLLVTPDNVTALADALRRLAGAPDLRATLGKAARQRVIEEFSDEVNLARLGDAMDHATSPCGPARTAETR